MLATEVIPQELASIALAEFETLPLRIANGEQVNERSMRETLFLANKSIEDLERAVDRIFGRRRAAKNLAQAKQDLDTVKRLEAEHEQHREHFAATVKRLQDEAAVVLKELEDAAISIFNRKVELQKHGKGAYRQSLNLLLETADPAISQKIKVLQVELGQINATCMAASQLADEVEQSKCRLTFFQELAARGESRPLQRPAELPKFLRMQDLSTAHWFFLNAEPGIQERRAETVKGMQLQHNRIEQQANEALASCAPQKLRRQEIERELAELEAQKLIP